MKYWAVGSGPVMRGQCFAAFMRLARRAVRPAVLRLVKRNTNISLGRFNGLTSSAVGKGAKAPSSDHRARLNQRYKRWPNSPSG